MAVLEGNNQYHIMIQHSNSECSVCVISVNHRSVMTVECASNSWCSFEECCEDSYDDTPQIIRPSHISSLNERHIPEATYSVCRWPWEVPATCPIAKMESIVRFYPSQTPYIHSRKPGKLIIWLRSPLHLPLLFVGADKSLFGLWMYVVFASGQNPGTPLQKICRSHVLHLARHLRWWPGCYPSGITMRVTGIPR